MPITAIRTVPLIRSISAYATVTGQVASARLEWRRAGEVLWRRGLPVALVGSELRGAVIGPPQWRSPTLPPPGLDPDSNYDLRVSVDFADGSFDQAEIQARTVPLEPPAPLRRFYVDPANGLDTQDGSISSAWKTIGRFMGYVNGVPDRPGGPQPGDACVLFPGVYAAGEYFNTRFHAGTPQDYITVEALDPLNKPVLSGGLNYYGTQAAAYVFPAFGYWAWKNVIFRDTPNRQVWAGAPGVWLVDCEFSRCGSPEAWVRVNASGPFRLIRPRFRWNPGDPDNSGFPIYMSQDNQGQISLLDLDTDLNGQAWASPTYRDGVATYPEDYPGGGWVRDGELHGGRFYRCSDDAYQFEGSCDNVRAWGNYSQDTFRNVGLAQPLGGPVYIVRNVHRQTADFYSLAWRTSQCARIKLGGAGMSGPLYLLNNTYFAPDSPDFNANGVQGDGIQNNVYARNNLLVVGRAFSYNLLAGGAGNDWNNDLGCVGKSFSGYFADVNTNTKYNSMAELAAATGLETRGVEIPWADRWGLVRDAAAGDYTSAGAAVDRGEDVPGVTDDFQGAGPDIGAIESGLTASTFSLTTSVVGQGVVTVQPLGGQYLQGTPVTLTATPAAGWRFVEWQGDRTGSQNPAVLTMDANKSVTAVFEQAPAIVTVSVQGSGTTDPAPGPITVPPGGSLTITAIPAENWQFAGWSGSGGYTSPDATITIPVTGDMALVATFVAVTFQVTIEVSPPEGGTTVPAPGIASYQQGQDITITAIQAGGYYFVEWRLNGQPLLPSPNPLPLTIQASGTVTAVFDRVVVPPGTVTYSITALPGGTTEPAPGVYGPVPVNTVVQIEARPDARKALDRWEYLGLTSRANPLVVQLPQDASIVAVFRDAPQPGVSIPVVLTVLATGVGLIQLVASTQKR